MKRKIILISLFSVFSVYSMAQQLTFSPAVEKQSSEDTSKKVIAQLWEDYIHSLRDELPDSIQKSFWYKGSEDMMKGIPPTNFYQSGGNLFTFDIRKYSDSIYEIHSLQQIITPENPVILYIYKVCAIETGGTFKLLNFFDAFKYTLQNYNSENVEFYYPCEFNFDIEKVEAAEKFIKQFRNDYNLKKTEKKIVCIIGNSFNESSSFMGFNFIIGADESRSAAMYQFPRTILTQRQDHIHEFVHALIVPAYPAILDILNEGIATYYGGTSGFEYVYHRNNLKKYISENPFDFSESSLFYTIKIGQEKTQLYYIIGALIIEYTLKNHGISKVIELFSCKDYLDIYSKLGIKPDDIVRFLLN